MKIPVLSLLLIFALTLTYCAKIDDHHKKDDKELYKDNDKKDYPCIELIYPVSYIMPDSSVITGSDKKDLGDLIKAWYTANPNVLTKPELQYPVKVKFKEKIFDVMNEQEMIKIKKLCKK